MITTKKERDFFYKIMLVDDDADAQTLFDKSIETKDLVQHRTTTSKVTQHANPVIRIYWTSHFTKCPSSKNKAEGGRRKLEFKCFLINQMI